MEVDMGIIAASKKDRIPHYTFGELIVPLDDTQRELVQFLTDWRMRASVPFEHGEVAIMHAIFAALLIAGEKKVIFYNMPVLNLTLLLEPFGIEVEKLDLAADQKDGWFYVDDSAEASKFAQHRDYVLVSEGLPDPVFGLLFPKALVIDRLSAQFHFDFSKAAQSASICSARHNARALYPAVVMNMPSKGNQNFKRRGYSLFPLMGAFNKYILDSRPEK